jgi:hypothetical protein
MGSKVPAKLTDAQRDALDAFVRTAVLGLPAKVTFIEVTGEMKYPPYPPYMTEEELRSYRENFPAT